MSEKRIKTDIEELGTQMEGCYDRIFCYVKEKHRKVFGYSCGCEAVLSMTASLMACEMFRELNSVKGAVDKPKGDINIKEFLPELLAILEKSDADIKTLSPA